MKCAARATDMLIKRRIRSKLIMTMSSEYVRLLGGIESQIVCVHTGLGGIPPPKMSSSGIPLVIFQRSSYHLTLPLHKPGGANPLNSVTSRILRSQQQLQRTMSMPVGLGAHPAEILKPPEAELEQPLFLAMLS